MKAIRSLILSTVAVAALSATAARADSAFDGAYAGVMGSYDWFSGNAKASVGGSRIKSDATGDGATAGIFAGYGETFEIPELASGLFYLGAEAEGSYYTGSNNQGSPYLQGHVAPDYSTGVSLRAGYVVTPDALAYVRVGWEHMGSAFSLSSPLVGQLASDYRTFDGVQVGAGVDYMVTERLFARVEYTYSDYGQETIPVAGVGVHLGPDEHQIRVGVGVHF